MKEKRVRVFGNKKCFFKKNVRCLGGTYLASMWPNLPYFPKYSFNYNILKIIF